MGNIQIDLVYFINNGLQNPFLDWIVPIIYSITDVMVILALIVLAIIGSWILKKEKICRIALLCLFAFCFACVFIFTLKTFYPTIRPFIALEGVRLAVHDNGFYSFPSGHFAISTMALSVILLSIEKHKREMFALSTVYLLILAFVVIYGGVHYPLDIIGGIIIGVASAVIVVRYFAFLADNLVKRIF